MAEMTPEERKESARKAAARWGYVIAAINNQSIVMLAIGCAALLAYIGFSPRYRSTLPSYIVTFCGLLILAFGLKDGARLLAVLGVAVMGIAAIIWYLMGGAKNL